jgi:D-threo-aldose 1-dehydrogenase
MPVTFNYGYITDENYAKACSLWSIVERFGEASPRAAALQFVLAHPDVTGVIVGASTPAHIDELKASIERPIQSGLFEELRAADILDSTLPLP